MDRKFVRTPELAELTGTSKRFWEKLRLAGGGPPYCRFGGIVAYDLNDVLLWLDQRKRTSTSDPGHQAA
jgi:predicted DNA-binding transcriptional regulator AlpA